MARRLLANRMASGSRFELGLRLCLLRGPSGIVVKGLGDYSVHKTERTCSDGQVIFVFLSVFT